MQRRRRIFTCRGIQPDKKKKETRRVSSLYLGWRLSGEVEKIEEQREVVPSIDADEMIEVRLIDEGPAVPKERKKDMHTRRRDQ